MICFNLVIERLFISGKRGYREVITMENQSFNLVIERLFISGRTRVKDIDKPHIRFNLVIERLFSSGQRGKPCLSSVRRAVSISQSRGFSVQCRFSLCFWGRSGVSISQSRCLSFQGPERISPTWLESSLFQSRNRDAFQVRLGFRRGRVA